MKNTFFLHLLLLLSLVSCYKPVDDVSVIARIGSTVLTDSMVDNAIGNDATEEVRLHYIREWVDVELLAKAARKEKLDHQKDIKQQLEEMERSLLASLYLQKHVGTVQSYGMSERVLRQYHADHQAEYLRSTPAIRLASIEFESIKEAWKVQKGLTVPDFIELKETQNFSDGFEVDSVTFVSVNSIDSSVVSYLFSLSDGSLSLPRKVNGKAYIYWVIEKVAEGTPATYEEVSEKVAIDAALHKYQDSLRFIKDQLRQSVDYYFNEQAVSERVSEETITVLEEQK